MDAPNTPKARILKAKSTPHKDSSGDSLSNTTEDLNHRLAEEMNGRMIENLPLDDFMDTFRNYSKIYTKKETGYDKYAPESLELRENLEAPPDTSEATILPWLKRSFNTIGAVHAATHPIPQAKNPNDNAAPLEIVDWFISSENTMQNATDNSRKMDFGMRTNGPNHMPHNNNSPDFTRVEIVAEHTHLNRILANRSGCNLLDTQDLLSTIN